MKRVLQKQRSALKFLASARPTYITEPTPTRTLLSARESDNLYVTLEEDFNDVLKTVSAIESSPNLKNKMQKLWSLVAMIRRSEIMLRELYEKTVNKQAGLKSSKTTPPLTNYELKKDMNLNVDLNVKTEDTMESPKSGYSKKMSFAVSKSEIEAIKEMFEREKQHLVKEIINLKEKLSKCTDSVDNMNKLVKNYEEQIKVLKDNSESQTSEILKELKLRQSYENRVKELQKQNYAKEKEIESLSFQCSNAKEQIKLFESTIDEQKLTNELLSQNNAHLSQKILKVHTEYNSQTGVFEELTLKYTKLSNQVKTYEENASKMLSDIDKNTKLKEACQKKSQVLESQKKDWLTEKEKLILSISTMEKNVENWRHLFENEKRKMEELKREKELLLKNFQRANVANDEQQRILKIEMRMKDQLEDEVNRLSSEVSRQTGMIDNLQKENERLKTKNTVLLTNMKKVQDSVVEQETEVSELKKQFNELEINYQHQNCLLDSIRSDKNTCSQNLTRAKEEASELKLEVKILTRRIEEEKENVAVKENELLTEKSMLQKLEQDKEKLYCEIGCYKETLQSMNNHADELQDELKKLNNVIQKMEQELQKKDKRILQVIGEQELTSTQLLQKTQEIAQLNAKLKLWEVTGEKQESECKAHVEEMKNLTMKISRLKADTRALNRNLATVANLRSDLFVMERELTKERVKCRALEEELQNPLNIHRWRKLEGTDPDSYELITRIQVLQKRLLTKSEIATEKEQQLKELGTLYENLRSTTAKLSPMDITNKLYFLGKALEGKNRRIKKLLVDIGMYESHAVECKLELESKNKKLDGLKKDYFKQKKQLFNMKNKKPAKSTTQQNNDAVNEASALGGGFLIKSARLPVIDIYD